MHRLVSPVKVSNGHVERRHAQRKWLGLTRQFSNQNSPAHSICGQQANKRSCGGVCCAGLQWRWCRSGPKRQLLRETSPVSYGCAIFFCHFLPKTYLVNYQPPGDRTTTDMLHFDQYFCVLYSDLMYRGHKVKNYVIFCSRVKIGVRRTFSAPPSSYVRS